MRFALATSLLVTLLGLLTLPAPGRTVSASQDRVAANSKHSLPYPTGTVFNLTDFGALPNGRDDAGPALQDALNALGAAGGGTLFVPAGRFALITPVSKDFTGLATEISIVGVESLTPAPPINAGGQELAHGLDLSSEFAPRTGETVAIHIVGLQKLLLKDLVFIGTPGIDTDAFITLALDDIQTATISHSEFYGLSTISDGGAIIQSLRTGFNLEQSVFLGCTSNSGVYGAVVQNLEWKSIKVDDTVFVDYGQRAELYGKLDNSAPYSWVNIGNAAAPESAAPRREAILRNVFFDEGALSGLASFPNRYLPQSAPLDLVYVSGLRMNVSNLNTSGFYLDSIENLLVENSYHGWSTNAATAINLLTVDNAILDRVECAARADRITADAATRSLTIIDSVYNQLDSLAQTTRVIKTAAPDDDAVQYVRQHFSAQLGRAPDPAAHFYWSDQILSCLDDAQCVEEKRTALDDYLASQPQETFSISGRIVDETGAGLGGIKVRLSGSQNVMTETETNGQYRFSNLPTSGIYSVLPSVPHCSLTPASYEIVTPAVDQIFNAVALPARHEINGRVVDPDGNAMPDVAVTLSGSQSQSMATGADGQYSFAALRSGGNYTVTPVLASYSFSPASVSFADLDSDQTQDFVSTSVTYTIGGILVGANNDPIAGAAVVLSGSQQRSTVSDATGSFAFAGVPGSGSYIVTPTRLGNSFSPAFVSYSYLSGNQYSVYSGSSASFLLSGRLSEAGGQALSGATINLSGSQSGATTSDVGGNYSFSVPAGGSFTVTPAKTNYVFTPASVSCHNLAANLTADFQAAAPSVLEFSSQQYSVSEGTRTITITVTRSGNSENSTSVIYSAHDGSADQRGDVIPIIGRLVLKPGEVSKSFLVFITDDARIESSETINLELSDPIGGLLGANHSATLTIFDNDSDGSQPNPIDDPRFFVRQHYRDFLNRSADADGLAFWSNQISSCGADAACIADRRMNVSAAFFLSIEFQQTGFLVYRLYQAAFAQAPRHIDEFLLDTRTIGAGLVVNAPGWEDLLAANTTQFIENFVARPDFSAAYPTGLTPAEFVDLLNANAGSPLATSEVATAVAEFNGAATSEAVAARARVLRRVAESQPFSQRQLNPAFVLMQYFGYLQRNASESPDTNLNGYYFWLNKLNEFGGDFRRAEMVKSFLVSGEYRARFGTP
ncbi:MAG: hypothetical protein QOD33_572 [Pyrinomonadaceae bacterium]|jgi:hypothetical protein|nr:hypothetical protein [Pyrinomonadaceae bacterium]